MYIKREISKKLLNVSKKFQVIAVVGPRQSGKTTLVKKIFNNYKYLNLEDPGIRALIENDPKGILESDTKIIIDEAQRMPELFSYIQVIVDENPKAKFILTGSQNFILHEKISQSLAGRIYISHLLPFNLSEIKKLKTITTSHEIIFNGFYPPLHDKNIDVSGWIPSYIQTHLEKDVRQIMNIQNLNRFSDFLRLCAGRSGQILNITSLANDTGISVNTAKNWISILEASYIIYLLKPYHKNFNKRTVKSPKLYFIDTGILAYLLDIRSANQVEHHFAKGAIFENLIITEFLKFFNNHGMKSSIFYWRENHGNEIDCIIESANGLKAIEIKAGKSISKDYFKRLNYFSNISHSANLNSYVVYGGNKIQKSKTTVVLPWNKMSTLLNDLK